MPNEAATVAIDVVLSQQALQATLDNIATLQKALLFEGGGVGSARSGVGRGTYAADNGPPSTPQAPFPGASGGMGQQYYPSVSHTQTPSGFSGNVQNITISHVATLNIQAAQVVNVYGQGSGAGPAAQAASQAGQQAAAGGGAQIPPGQQPQPSPSQAPPGGGNNPSAPDWMKQVRYGAPANADGSLPYWRSAAEGFFPGAGRLVGPAAAGMVVHTGMEMLNAYNAPERQMRAVTEGERLTDALRPLGWFPGMGNVIQGMQAITNLSSGATDIQSRFGTDVNMLYDRAYHRGRTVTGGSPFLPTYTRSDPRHVLQGVQYIDAYSALKGSNPGLGDSDIDQIIAQFESNPLFRGPDGKPRPDLILSALKSSGASLQSMRLGMPQLSGRTGPVNESDVVTIAGSAMARGDYGGILNIAAMASQAGIGGLPMGPRLANMANVAKGLAISEQRAGLLGQESQLIEGRVAQLSALHASPELILGAMGENASTLRSRISNVKGRIADFDLHMDPNNLDQQREYRKLRLEEQELQTQLHGLPYQMAERGYSERMVGAQAVTQSASIGTQIAGRFGVAGDPLTSRAHQSLVSSLERQVSIAEQFWNEVSSAPGVGKETKERAKAMLDQARGAVIMEMANWITQVAGEQFSVAGHGGRMAGVNVSVAGQLGFAPSAGDQAAVRSSLQGEVRQARENAARFPAGSRERMQWEEIARQKEGQLATLPLQQINERFAPLSQIAGAEGSIASAEVQAARLNGQGSAQTRGMEMEGVRSAERAAQLAQQRAIEIRAALGPNSAQTRQAEAEAAQARLGVASARTALGDVTIPTAMRESMEQTSYELQIMRSMPGAYGNVRGLLQNRIGELQGEAGYLSGELSARGGEMTEEGRASLRRRLREVGLEQFQAFNELNMGWEQRLETRMMNAPGNFNLDGRGFSMRNAVLRGVINPHFGMRGSQLPFFMQGAALQGGFSTLPGQRNAFSPVTGTPLGGEITPTGMPKLMYGDATTGSRSGHQTFEFILRWPDGSVAGKMGGTVGAAGKLTFAAGQGGFEDIGTLLGFNSAQQ